MFICTKMYTCLSVYVFICTAILYTYFKRHYVSVYLYISIYQYSNNIYLLTATLNTCLSVQRCYISNDLYRDTLMPVYLYRDTIYQFIYTAILYTCLQRYCVPVNLYRDTIYLFICTEIPDICLSLPRYHNLLTVILNTCFYLHRDITYLLICSEIPHTCLSVQRYCILVQSVTI